MKIEEAYKPPVLTFENIHEHCSTVATGLYKCARCKSRDIDPVWIIKYWAHHLFLCNKCSARFVYLLHNKEALSEVPDTYGHLQFHSESEEEIAKDE